MLSFYYVTVSVFQNYSTLCDSSVITRCDQCIQDTLEVILNIQLSESAWLQASLHFFAHCLLSQQISTQYLFIWLRYGGHNVLIFGNFFKVKCQGRVRLPSRGFPIAPHSNMTLSVTVWPQYVDVCGLHVNQ